MVEEIKSEILQMLILLKLFPGEQTAVHLRNALELAWNLAPPAPLELPVAHSHTRLPAQALTRPWLR